MDATSPKLRLRDQFCAVIRVNHYSIRTEQSYWYWIRYFIRFHQLRHPLELGTEDVNAFLSWLATKRRVAAATQNLALNAIVFLYARVLEQPFGRHRRDGEGQTACQVANGADSCRGDQDHCGSSEAIRFTGCAHVRIGFARS